MNWKSYIIFKSGKLSGNDSLERLFNSNDNKIILGDFNAQMGNEEICRITATPNKIEIISAIQITKRNNDARLDSPPKAKLFIAAAPSSLDLLLPLGNTRNLRFFPKSGRTG